MPSWTRADIPDQTGRTAVVTGANAGLGQQIALGLAGGGATVVLACRNTAKADAAAASIRGEVPDAQVEVRSLDLADLSSVTAFVEGFTKDHDALDLLVNNAGLMAVDEERTVDGFEMQIGVNHLGHHALTAGLLPLMVDRPGSRVAAMSSFGHRPGTVDVDDLNWERRRYLRWPAYFQSKLANLLFTLDLQRRLEAAGAATIAVAAHPGASRTDLGTEGSGLTNRITALVVPFTTQPASAGALPMLRAVTAPDVKGGEYYGPRFMGFGPAVRETPSGKARDAGTAVRLAARSQELTGATLPV
jgi:NAD(P)-dependent dehydrogenase (short-subunit alcohol dehydrogenase family)